VVSQKARDCRVEVQCRFGRPSHAGCRALLHKLDPLLRHQVRGAAGEKLLEGVARSRRRATTTRKHTRAAAPCSCFPSSSSVLFAVLAVLGCQLGVAARCDLAAAVREVVAAEADPAAADAGAASPVAPPWLSPELRDVFEGAADAASELAALPKQLQYLSGVVTDLFVDWRKLDGNEDVRHAIPRLHAFLAHEYSLEGLEHMFGLRE